MKCLAKRDLDALNLDALSTERKEQVETIKNSITFTYEGTLDYASRASQNLTDFSSDLLKTMKVKDVPEVETLVAELMAGLEKVDVTTLTENKPSFLRKLFKVDELKQFISRYEDVESIIAVAKEKLEVANFQLKKDIMVCDKYLEQNLAYINELDNYIMAGRIRIVEEQSILDADRAMTDGDDMLVVHQLNARQGEIDRFERKLHNLMLMRAIAIQNIPQIILIKDGDSVLVEKIEASINSAIPLWESQMVIAIQLMRQKGALAIQRSVTNTTNNLIAKNGELLKSGSIEVAKELETGIVDVEVLKKNSENLIATLEAINTIQKDGKKSRLKATQELGILQSKLNEQLLLGGKDV
jgi:uncharacterized protein YaaN involved in tellurite resistance